jgi:hypothetical protein
MILALVLIVATDSARTPVAAVPRSLSDYAAGHRLRGDGAESGRGGGFSAAESTIPRDAGSLAPAFVADAEERWREPPEPVVVAPPVYGPVWWVSPGGGRRPPSRHVHTVPAPRARAPRAVRMR